MQTQREFTADYDQSKAKGDPNEALYQVVQSRVLQQLGVRITFQ